MTDDQTMRLRLTVPKRPIYDELWQILRDNKKHAALILLEYAVIGLAVSKHGSVAALPNADLVDTLKAQYPQGDDSILEDIGDDLDSLAF